MEPGLIREAHRSSRPVLAALCIGLLAASCSGKPEQPPAAPAPATQISVYDWDGDLPESLLEWFGREQGVTVRRHLYESQEEAIAALRSGAEYDVVVMEGRNLPLLIREKLVAELDYRLIPNRKNLSANFRDLSSDPGNRHSVPFSFGTTGLMLRQDAIAGRTVRWKDLWNPSFRGRAGVWVGVPREILGFTLKSLGHSANSEIPEQIEEAVARFLEIAPHLVALEDYGSADSSEAFLRGGVVLAHGYAADLIALTKKQGRARYVLPAEGALLWNDCLVVPAASRHKELAAAFLDFMLRPDVAARFVADTGYAVPNDAVLPLLPPELRADRSLFPLEEDLRNAEPLLALSAVGEALHLQAIERIVAAVPRKTAAQGQGSR